MPCSPCPPTSTITPTAERRLKVLQSLDTLGAGFQLASHDLDIRGAGNLLGDEQSGHIKEVGYELYQQMLEEAVAALKEGGVEAEVEEQWSPQITIGTPVMIPEEYVPDLQLRLGLYRRLSTLDTDAEIDAFGAELTDRFGERPPEVDQLLKLMSIKALCRRANVEKVDAGPKGVVVSFRDNAFANPDGLVRYIAEQGSFAKVRPDMRIVFSRDFESPDDRTQGNGRDPQEPRPHRREEARGVISSAPGKRRAEARPALAGRRRRAVFRERRLRRCAGHRAAPSRPRPRRRGIHRPLASKNVVEAMDSAASPSMSSSAAPVIAGAMTPNTAGRTSAI